MTGRRDCLPAKEVLTLVCDKGTFIPNPTVHVSAPTGINVPGPYSVLLDKARKGSGQHCAVQWGSAKICGNSCIVMANEFAFIGGSLGAIEASEICRAMETAASDRLAFVWLAAGGGCRVMEGLPPMLLIPRILAARNRLAQMASPLIAVTVGPNLGGDRLITTQADFAVGVEKTWLGFVGPKVIEGFDKAVLPDGFQSTEWAIDNGQLDQVVSMEDLPGTLGRLLSVLGPAKPVEMRCRHGKPTTSQRLGKCDCRPYHQTFQPPATGGHG
jgi:acetyl-CoA carboxylase carboxyl transferase subunit beta